MKIGLLQMTSGTDPTANAAVIESAIAGAAAQGAVMLFTPEMSGLLDSNGARAANHVVTEHEDLVLARVSAAAAGAGIWVHLGSLAVKSDGNEPRWANRGFVIDAAGEIVAHYDKLHLFDVDLPTGESWRESSRYVPGPGTAVIDTPVGDDSVTIFLRRADNEEVGLHSFACCLGIGEGACLAAGRCRRDVRGQFDLLHFSFLLLQTL